ncbi:GAF domain-containing protein [Oscillatoria sp. FACHB-1407]|uniref:GAF domain-containing protein n=1 Tax=Oscillatoria sp. FACHB-1407 TaxID=2692847 RepID=UPI00168964C6|nr:GAF domain-containing protein [Oscillatoria sp. FACHB-1407]MBD2465805.1 GAF domain-containing protein [Oscillatoria sp. FACHB-1407]
MVDAQQTNPVWSPFFQLIHAGLKELLKADRVTLFLLDREQNILWSIISSTLKAEGIQINIPADQGFAGEAATSKQVIHLPYDCYDDPRAAMIQQTDQKTGYRTYTLLIVPLVNQNGDVIAVVNAINKLKPSAHLDSLLAERVDLAGFTVSDQETIQAIAPIITPFLSSLN